MPCQGSGPSSAFLAYPLSVFQQTPWGKTNSNLLWLPIVALSSPCARCNTLAVNVLELLEKATVSVRCYWKPGHLHRLPEAPFKQLRVTEKEGQSHSEDGVRRHPQLDLLDSPLSF